MILELKCKKKIVFYEAYIDSKTDFIICSLILIVDQNGFESSFSQGGGGGES